MSEENSRNTDAGEAAANPERTVVDEDRTPHAANSERPASSEQDPEVAASNQDWEQVADEVRDAAEHADSGGA